MEKLKFEKRTEYKILTSPDYRNIFSGLFSFATQNTAVYADFCLVYRGNEIMKINTCCDKIFANETIIAILNGQSLDIYENKKWKKSLSIQKPEGLMDFTNDFENLDRIYEENTSVFVVNGNLLKVDANTILLNEKSFQNTIHEENCTYFVAWKDDITILGNSKSCDFMYFYKEDLIEPEEYYPLCLRVDHENFESIPAKNIKFWEGQVLLIDNDVISAFTINKNDSNTESEIRVVEYKISNQEIIQLQEGLGLNNDLKEGSFLETKGSNFKSPISMTTENSLESEKQLLPGVEGILPRPIGLLETHKPIDLLEAHRPIEVLEAHRPIDLLEAHRPIEVLETHKPIATSIKEDKKKEPLNTFSQFYSSLNTKKATQPQKEHQEAHNVAIDKFDKEFTAKIANLKERVSIIDKRVGVPKGLVLIPSKFDLDGLYNLIFHNNIEEYENILSSMIVQIENLQSISENQINECIKFFDSKIFENKAYKKPVSYKDPLCTKMSSVLSIKNPFEDILRGIKVLEVDFQGQKMNFKKSGLQDKSAEAQALPNNTVQKSTEDIKVFQELKSIPSTFTAMKESSTLVNNSIKENEIGNFTSIIPTIQQASNSFPFEPSKEQPSFAQVSNPLSIQQKTLFNNDIQEQSNGLFVADTSSLFNNIATNTLNIQVPNLEIQQNNTPSTDTNTPTAPVSAFNRLAGSRRLFQ
ncbi:hypothetical protein GINT2_000271 [Glugoides intestinalis]